ncbi:hypothetical protein [Halobacteriovorax sp.]|uniref:hypothetical protein n=1 Tax=Halobacteriovorax sp. TaxID=2020862 RepID=UPI003AF27212
MSKKIAYFGHDLGYWDDLKKRFINTYHKEQFDFIDLKVDETTVNHSIYELFKFAPNVVYIDIKENDKASIDLARLLKKINFFSMVPVVALVTNVKEVMNLISDHLDFVFVKGVETHDIVYHPFMFKYPEIAESEEFAMGALEKPAPIKLKEIARVGYYGLSSMHVETANKIESGKLIEVEHHLPSDHMATKYFNVLKSGSEDIYYGSRYWLDLEYLYVDPAKKEDGSFSLNVEDLREDELNKKLKLGKSLKKWVNENASYGSRKRTKLLMVDPDMSYFEDNKKHPDTYDFVFRINEKFDSEFKNITRIMPDIIVYSFPTFNEDTFVDTEDEDDKKKNSNPLSLDEPGKTVDVEGLSESAKKLEAFQRRQDAIFSELITRLKSFGADAPYLIILNCTKYTSKSFQDKYSYQYALVNPNKIGMNVLAQMIHQLEEKRLQKEEQDINAKIAALRKKDPMKYAKVNKTYFDPPKYFVSKKDEMSHALIIRDASLVEISESTCFFTTKEEVGYGNYYLTHPFNLAVKIVPQEGKLSVKEGDTYKYHGLIHAIGEKEKMRLRQFVNDVYTQHKKDEREKEAQEQQEANKRFIEEKEKARLEAEAVASADSESDEEKSSAQETQEKELTEDEKLMQSLEDTASKK